MVENQPANNQSNETLSDYLKSNNLEESKVIEILKGLKTNEKETPTEQKSTETQTQTKETKKEESLGITKSELEKLIDISVQNALKGTRKENPKSTPSDISFNANSGMIGTSLGQRKIEPIIKHTK